MEVLAGFLILYVIYVVAVRALPDLVMGLAWVAMHGARGLFFALRWTGRGLGKGARKPWQLFHKLRLGKAEFFARSMASLWVADYAAVKREGAKGQARQQYRGIRLAWESLKWDLWAVRMQAYGACYHVRAKEFVDEIQEQQRREAEARRAWEEAERLRREESERQRRAEAERTEREQAERQRREEAQRASRERAERQRQQRRHHRRPGKPSGATDPYGAALALLGLRENCTRKAFSKAYRKAMTSAHPDAGGSTEKAQAVNAARDLIKKRNGW